LVFTLIIRNVLLQDIVTIKIVNKEYPDDVKKYLAERAALARSKRWANHSKQTEEEKKAKWREYMREYRKRNKNERKDYC